MFKLNSNPTYPQLQQNNIVSARGNGEAGQRADPGLLVIHGGIVSPPSDLRYQKQKERFHLQDIARKLLPGESIRGCLRYRQDVSKGVYVLYSRDHKTSHYGNLQTCGLSWVCPVCSAKISERRRTELKSVTDNWLSSGRDCFMVTFTFQHNKSDKLADIFQSEQTAYRQMRQGKSWQNLEQRFGIVGTVTSHEITYSEASGFHPHKHVLFYSNKQLTKLDYQYIEVYLSVRWENMLIRSGRYAKNGIGVQVSPASSKKVAEYIAKWGITEELTKVNQKIGKNTDNLHYTPFQLLELISNGCKWASDIFLEYATATKGKKQLVYSPGLRDILKLAVMPTDEELVSQVDDKTETIGVINIKTWNYICKNQLRANVLDVATQNDKYLFQKFIANINKIGRLSYPSGLD